MTHTVECTDCGCEYEYDIEDGNACPRCMSTHRHYIIQDEEDE